MLTAAPTERPFEPRHLQPQQVANIYAQALAQAEHQVLDAWINHRLNPQDSAALARYEQGREQLAALEADRARVLEPAP